MTAKTKSVLTGFLLSVAAPLFVSIVVAVGAMMSGALAKANRVEGVESRIDRLEAGDSVLISKLEKIAEDVSFIRGKLSNNR